MNTDDNILRSETYSPLATKGSGLTSAELDDNFINVYKDFEALRTTVGVDAYDPAIPYANDYTNPETESFATYDNKLWLWVNASPMDILFPSTPAAGSDWLEIFPTALGHERNRDQYLQPVTLTYAEAVLLASSGGLIKGAPYQIADKDISIHASTAETFCTAGCRVMRIVKATYYVASGTILGVWKPTLTPTSGDFAVWGGKVWLNLAGAVGSILDDGSLSADWALQPTTDDTYYEDKSFLILYDFENDWVSRQHDDRGNIFGLPYSAFLPFNPVDISDWGDLNVFDNICHGVYNNANFGTQSNVVNGDIFRNYNDGFISQNTNNGDIFNNSNPFGITFNSNSGTINQNSNAGEISYNSNNGQIQSNSNGSDIVYNTNTGEITNCSNTGSIRYNSNVGFITAIGAANVNVQYNINNGSISTTTTGDISDTIVNK